MTDTQRYWDGKQWTEHRAPGTPQAAKRGTPGEVWFGIGAAVLMMLGAIGPWVDAVFVSVGGLNGDGIIVLVAALAACIGLGFAAQGAAKAIGAVAAWVMLCGLVGAATSIYDLTQVLGSETRLFGEEVRIGSPGWGLWLSAGASVGLTVAGAALFALDRRR